MNTTEESIMEMLLRTQTELINTYAEHHDKLIRLDAPVDVLCALHDEYEMVMKKINYAIERQKIIDRMK